MAGEPQFVQNLDVLRGTLERIMKREPVLSYAYETYDDLNIWMSPNIMKVTGDELKGFITTGTVGNAGAKNPWAKDNLIVKNVTKEYSIPPFKCYSGGMAFNKTEVKANKGPEKIFDVVKLQYRIAKKELVEALRAAYWSAPTSSSDLDSMYSIPCWLAVGTQASTGGFTGYQARYNDSSTPGTAFAKGGLSSSASSNPEMANYYADHEGDIGEPLLRLVNEANMRLNFKPPSLVPDSAIKGNSMTKYASFTTKNVMLTLNQLYQRINSDVGPNMFAGGYYPMSMIPLPGAIRLVWNDILDTADLQLYGTDPIFGVNMNVLYPTVLSGENMVVTEKDNPDRHKVREVYIDFSGTVWCDEPRYAGYLISSHPSN